MQVATLQACHPGVTVTVIRYRYNILVKARAHGRGAACWGLDLQLQVGWDVREPIVGDGGA